MLKGIVETTPDLSDAFHDAYNNHGNSVSDFSQRWCDGRQRRCPGDGNQQQYLSTEPHRQDTTNERRRNVAVVERRQNEALCVSVPFETTVAYPLAVRRSKFKHRAQQWTQPENNLTSHYLFPTEIHGESEKRGKCIKMIHSVLQEQQEEQDKP